MQWRGWREMNKLVSGQADIEEGIKSA